MPAFAHAWQCPKRGLCSILSPTQSVRGSNTLQKLILPVKRRILSEAMSEESKNTLVTDVTPINTTKRATPADTKSLRKIFDGAPPVTLKMPAHTTAMIENKKRVTSTANTNEAAPPSPEKKPETLQQSHVPTKPAALPRFKPIYAIQVPDITNVPQKEKQYLKWGPKLEIHVPDPENRLDEFGQPLHVLALSSAPTKMWIAFSGYMRQLLAVQPLDQYTRVDLPVHPSVIRILNGWMIAVCSDNANSIIWTRRLDWLQYIPLFKAVEDLAMPAACDQLLAQIKPDLRDGQVSLADTLSLWEHSATIGAVAPRKALIERIFGFLKFAGRQPVKLEDINTMVRVASGEHFMHYAVARFAQTNYARDPKGDEEVLGKASPALREMLAAKWRLWRWKEAGEEKRKAARGRWVKERKERQAVTWDSGKGKMVTKVFY